MKKLKFAIVAMFLGCFILACGGDSGDIRPTGRYAFVTTQELTTTCSDTTGTWLANLIGEGGFSGEAVVRLSSEGDNAIIWFAEANSSSETLVRRDANSTVFLGTSVGTVNTNDGCTLSLQEVRTLDVANDPPTGEQNSDLSVFQNVISSSTCPVSDDCTFSLGFQLNKI